ncbi:hypothetical protein FA13DRAFT_1727422 [Coprinellus micaceus]|uniref:Uncharacterized protein n=1 Tax=Coprinellus micaceus TaxID=71717 RepID=A0A4Y7TQM1_COPMI|nr:hypothetical protein FA13DRAFT_1727422 [Coprinellus micaceus]
MSDFSAPRRPYGLPSNPRQAASLKHAKSQSNIIQRQPEPVSNAQRSSAPSRARSRSRDTTASSSRDRAASTSRTAPRPRYPPSSSHSVVSSASSDYGVPREDTSSLRSRPKASWNSPPRSTNRVERPPEDAPSEEPDVTTPTNQESTEAAPLWKQVVTTLTVNVSKAISSTVGEGDGEATPVGAESRLTKAMKTYYLSKARDQSELPDWLFSEKERRVTSSRRQKSRDRGASPPPEVVGLPRHRTAMSQDSSPRPPPTTRPQPSNSMSTRRDFRTAGNTADRLAALRERGRHVEKAASTSRIPVGGAGR